MRLNDIENKEDIIKEEEYYYYQTLISNILVCLLVFVLLISNIYILNSVEYFMIIGLIIAASGMEITAQINMRYWDTKLYMLKLLKDGD